MKRIKNSFNLLSRLSDAFIPLLGIFIFIPVSLLIFAGVYFIYKEGYFLYFVLSMLAMSLVLYVIYIFIKKNKKNTEHIKSIEGDDIRIEPSHYWSEFDNTAWEKSGYFIDELLKKGMDWSTIDKSLLQVNSKIASYYHPENSEKELEFTMTEALLAIEEISRRYRGYIKEYVPFEQNIKPSLFKHIYNHQDKFQALNSIYNTYRVFRIASPITAAFSEMKGALVSHLFNEVGESIQNKIKKALLEEVAYVSIDLYGGHFKVRDSELQESKSHMSDKSKEPATIEPLRIVIVGQTGSGKSSIFNKLIDQMIAEVSIVPSTGKSDVRNCKIDGIDVFKLIDTQGLAGSARTEAIIIDEMIKSDIVIWVLRADQSSRELDVKLKDSLDSFYKKVENRGRKKPKILALLNQVDKFKPTNKWNPPYDLQNCNTSDKKACTIRDAVAYIKKELKFDNILPLAINPELEFYNLNALKEYIKLAYNEGINTQLNRRRLEHPDDGLTESSRKLVKLGKKLFLNSNNSIKESNNIT